jgi:hypothetical protein
MSLLGCSEGPPFNDGKFGRRDFHVNLWTLATKDKGSDR